MINPALLCVERGQLHVFARARRRTNRQRLAQRKLARRGCRSARARACACAMRLLWLLLLRFVLRVDHELAGRRRLGPARSRVRVVLRSRHGRKQRLACGARGGAAPHLLQLASQEDDQEEDCGGHQQRRQNTLGARRERGRRVCTGDTWLSHATEGASPRTQLAPAARIIAVKKRSSMEPVSRRFSTSLMNGWKRIWASSRAMLKKA